MSIEFTDTEIPATAKVGRKPLDNPFTDLFPLDDAAKTFVITQKRDSTEAKRIVRQVRAAAKAVDRTGRVEMEDTDKGTKITVWTIPSITREAKPTEGTGRAAVQKAAKGGQPK